MICPKCQKQPITFLNFFFKLTPKNIKCKNCGAELKLGKLLRRSFYFAYVFGLILGLSIATLKDIYNWKFNTSALLFILIIAIVGIPVEYFLWTRGSFEEKIEK